MTAKLCLTSVTLYQQAVFILRDLRKTYEIFYYQRIKRKKKDAEEHALNVKKFIDDCLESCTKEYALIAVYYNDIGHLEVIDMIEKEYVIDKSKETIICVDNFSKEAFRLKALEAKIQRQEKGVQRQLF